MEFKKGDKVICVSIVPNEKLIEVFGDYSFTWYSNNLKLCEIYTIFSSEGNVWEQLRLVDKAPTSYFSAENFRLLKEVRREKLNKLYEKREKI